MLMRTRTARLLGLAAALAAGAIALAGATSAGAAGASPVACPSQFQSTIYHGSDTVTFCNYASYNAATHQVRGVGEIRTAAGLAKTSMSELDVSFFDDFGTTSYLVERAVFPAGTHFGRTAPSNCLPAEWYAITIKYSIRWSDGTATHDEYPVFYNPGAACS
jgi:hypothetical protein